MSSLVERAMLDQAALMEADGRTEDAERIRACAAEHAEFCDVKRAEMEAFEAQPQAGEAILAKPRRGKVRKIDASEVEAAWEGGA